MHTWYAPTALREYVLLPPVPVQRGSNTASLDELPCYCSLARPRTAALRFFPELFIFAGYLTSVANAALHY